MAMDAQQRSQFVDAYTRLLITTWSSEEFANRLGSDVHGALAEVGLEVPANATVERIREIPEGRQQTERGGLDVQVQEWERGLETGHFYLYIPDTPQVDISELSEGDLEGIAASSYVCCCCCPCCSC
jgi:hypothetical protein